MSLQGCLWRQCTQPSAHLTWMSSGGATPPLSAWTLCVPTQSTTGARQTPLLPWCAQAQRALYASASLLSTAVVDCWSTHVSYFPCNVLHRAQLSVSYRCTDVAATPNGLAIAARPLWTAGSEEEKIQCEGAGAIPRCLAMAIRTS